jgi:hypothetical protein
VTFVPLIAPLAHFLLRRGLNVLVTFPYFFNRKLGTAGVCLCGRTLLCFPREYFALYS